MTSDRQIVGNIGLYYVCHKLSWLGWNVMPTARNAKGIDIVAYQAPGDFVGIQVKTLSKKAAVGLGKSLDRVDDGDYWIIVSNAASETDVHVSVMLPGEVKKHAEQDKGGEKLFWLEHNAYSKPEFADKWCLIKPKSNSK